MKRLCVIIINYRRAVLTLECLRSLLGQIDGRPERCAVVIDNGSGDGSAEEIERTITEEGWAGWVRVVRSEVNGGFAAGNNRGFAAEAAEAYLLLNNDARLGPGVVDAMLASMDEHPEAGLIGPRLQGPDGATQVSCFRYRSPVSELLAAAGTGVLDRLFRRFVVAVGVFDEPTRAEWVSFACILVRRELIDAIGPMDEDYFMYFEDIDYARRARKAGWEVLHDPAATVTHLRGGSSSVKAALRSRSRVPRYYYESRTRYFAKFYGGVVGVILTNLGWGTGRLIALVRETLRTKEPHACAAEFRDSWTNWRRPFQPPTRPSGSDV